MYRIIRQIFSLCSPIRGHRLIIKLLRGAKRVGLYRLFRLRYNYKNSLLEREVFGVKFRNPVGLASGLDKNGDCYNLLQDFGFGFIEIGSLTPKEQELNVKNSASKVTLIPKEEAILNTTGISNLGVRHAVYYLKNNKPDCVIGANITCSPAAQSMIGIVNEFELAFEYLYDFVDYFCLNVSTPEVTDQGGITSISALSEVLDSLLTIRNMYDEYRPILLKISPDMDTTFLDDLLDIAFVSGLDGVIATNSTHKWQNLINDRYSNYDKNSCLSGKPLYQRSLEMVRHIAQKTNGQLPIIACGGISTPQQALEMLQSGASLIQIHSGLIYKGPSIVRKINRYLVKREKEKNKIDKKA